MGDVTRWAVKRFRADPADAALRSVLDFIESAFEKGEEEESELIAVSFLENLPGAGEDDAGLRALVGPSLRDQLRRVG